MTGPLLVDKDIFIDFLRGHDLAVKLINASSDHIVLSAVVVAELYSGVKGAKEKTIIDHFISLFRVIPITLEIAISGGLYKSKYAKSHGIGLADAIIAATADAENAELVTLNVKHYPMFKELKQAYKK